MMKRMLTPIFAPSFWVILLSNNGLAWEEPPDFRGVKWGSSFEELSRVFPGVSEIEEVGNVKFYSVSSQQIANIYVDYLFGFLNDKFGFVRLSFRSNDFEPLRDIFVSRYGRAHSTSTEVLRNAMGTKFLNSILNWNGATLTIILQKYESTIMDGTAQISKRSFAAGYEAAIKKRKIDAAKDL
jgi:hypothetical protein